MRWAAVRRRQESGRVTITRPRRFRGTDDADQRRVRWLFPRALIEVGDGTNWRTVYDRPKLVLTGMPAVFFLPDAAITEAAVSFELLPAAFRSDAPICMNWWPSDRRTLDGACLPSDGTPRIVPIYRPTAQMLRITLLESFTTAPWER